MADEEQVKILEQGAGAWNEWRRSNRRTKIDLASADLRQADLRGANFVDANLTSVDFVQADLEEVKFSSANLAGAVLAGTNLRGAVFLSANLGRADFAIANLSEAILIGARLFATNFTRASLDGANLGLAKLHETILNAVDLSTVVGLEDCQHEGRSCVDHRTIKMSKNVPLVFWRGCGIPDALIGYLTSLTGEAIQFYSCFIGYSSKDQEFADRLYADLQSNGVRCWFAQRDLPIGGDLWADIDLAISTRDKVVLILSKDALASDWVEDEVKKGFAEERERGKPMLFPLRIDDAVMDSSEAWATKLRDNRLIGDFIRWKDHDAYRKTFERVLRDLKQAG